MYITFILNYILCIINSFICLNLFESFPKKQWQVTNNNDLGCLIKYVIRVTLLAFFRAWHFMKSKKVNLHLNIFVCFVCSSREFFQLCCWCYLNQILCLFVERGLRIGMWGWPWAGRLLAASWRVLSVGAAGACLAWWGDRRGRTGERRGGWETQKDTKQNHTEIRTGLKHMHTWNHGHSKCFHGNIQICQIFDLPNANNKL